MLYASKVSASADMDLIVLEYIKQECLTSILAQRDGVEIKVTWDWIFFDGGDHIFSPFWRFKFSMISELDIFHVKLRFPFTEVG